MAVQQFERFKSQRELRIGLDGCNDVQQLMADLRKIDGVRKGSIVLEARSVKLSYHKGKVSSEQILAILRGKGHLK